MSTWGNSLPDCLSLGVLAKTEPGDSGQSSVGIGRIIEERPGLAGANRACPLLCSPESGLNVGVEDNCSIVNPGEA